ncbi:MAG: RNA polymerase sigma factor RpoD/SigA [Polyangiaceae bacterium]
MPSCQDDNSREELISIVARGSAARRRIVEANLGLVGYVVKRFFAASQVLDHDDLFNEGVIGLHRAVDRFDPDIGTMFSTYAVFWIRQTIQRAQQDKNRTIRIPVHAQELLRKAKKARGALSLEGRSPTVQEVADQLGVPVEKLLFLEHIARDPVSLDGVVGGDADSPLSSLMPSSGISPEDEYLVFEMRGAARDAAASLSPKEQRILALRFGLAEDSNDEHTLEEIGQEFGVTRERIRQIQEKAIERLRRRISSNPLADYLDDRQEDSHDSSTEP